MTPLGELLTPTDIAFAVEARSRDEVLAAVARFMAARHGLAERSVYIHLRDREMLGSTALGHGIALPHARMRTLDKPCAAYLRLQQAVEWEAPDRRPVRHCLALLVPAEAVERHLALMACAAEQFGDARFRERLRAASEPRDVALLFDGAPASGTGEPSPAGG